MSFFKKKTRWGSPLALLIHPLCTVHLLCDIANPPNTYQINYAHIGPSDEWWANIVKWARTNIWILSDATNLPNKYPNIFGCHIFTKEIFQYICTQKVTQIQIQKIFEGNFIRIFEYLYWALIVVTLEKGSLILSTVKQNLHWKII